MPQKLFFLETELGRRIASVSALKTESSVIEAIDIWVAMNVEILGRRLEGNITEETFSTHVYLFVVVESSFSEPEWPCYWSD